jgi:hypothetical protein
LANHTIHLARSIAEDANDICFTRVGFVLVVACS